MVNMVNHPKKDIRITSKPGHRCGFQHGGVVQRQVFTLQQRLQTTSRKAEVPGVLWDMWYVCQKLKLNQRKLWFKQHKHGVVTNKRGIETKKTGDSCLLVCWYTVYRGFGLVPPTNYLWESGCPSTRQLGCTIRDQNSWAKLTWIMFRKYQAIFQVKCQKNTTINRCYCAKLPLV